MNDAQALAKLLKAESILKQTEAAYSETGPRWKIAMPLLWEVRKDINSTVLGEKLAVAHGLLKETEKGYDPQAPRWQKAMAIIDDVEAELHRTPVPNLGPVLKGDKSLLLWVPTHQTDGLFRGTGSHYPAFDSGFGQVGRTIVAPERLKVRRQSSAAGADAFYATGVSKIEYWFGHLVRAPATGTWFDQGDSMGVIARIAMSDGGPHFHTGLDCRKLIGKDLKWGRRGNGPDYTFGSPTYGQQLAKELAS